MTRTAALRLSILVSLGLVPIACSGKTIENADDDEGGSGKPGGSGGTTSVAGKPRGGAMGKGGASVVGGTTGKGGTTSIAGGPGHYGCTDGRLDPVSGLLTCAEGYRARATAKTCYDSNGTGGVPSGQGGEGGVHQEETKPRATGTQRCVDDSECAVFDRGYCSYDEGNASAVGGASSVCLSGCSEDADCGDGYICLCSLRARYGGECLPSSCQTNAEYGTGFVCASYTEPCGSDGFACTTAEDECPSDECPASSCTFERSLGHRTCDGAVCGRPFLVEQQARVAPVVQSAAWCDRITPRVDHLTSAERADLAAHWTRLGQMEHASIAAFARFQLQLLALGAPADLVQACNQALVDETNHTQLCFGLASAYAGRRVGPGALDVSHSLDVTSLADIVDLVIAEGCVGETNAALEALEAADAATDPVIRGAYARIAADEQRHAELAFRFVRWALMRGDADVAKRVNAALGALPRTRPSRDVVRPCLQALLVV